MSGVTTILPRNKVLVGILLLGCLLLGGGIVQRHQAAAASCTPPATDYGSVSNLSVSLTSTATYRIWSRMAAPDATNNTYMLEVDGSSCYTVGGSSVPVYASGATTYFANDSSNWVSKTSSGTQIDVNLAAGTHTFKLIGTGPGVVVDRVILTQDTTCVPTGTGDNCAMPPDTTPPIVNITAPANNATISATTTATAAATDDVAVSKVEFYINGVLKATDTGSPYTYSINPATLGVGTYTLLAKAYDAAGNVTSSSPVTFTVPDMTPPAISAVAASGVSQTTANVTWTTDEAADSQIEYGTTASYGSSSALNATKVTSHTVGLTGLSPSTTYHYRVKSTDAAGNAAMSADATFTTQAPAADTTKPVVVVISPVANASILGTSVTVSATATDNVGVAGVQFKLNGVNIGTEDTVPSGTTFSSSFNTTTYSNGIYTLTAVARDAAGNTQTSASVSIVIANIAYNIADINQNGVVGIDDFGLLKAKFNQSGSGLGRADINGNGVVDIQDFGLLKLNFGKTGP